MRFISRVKRPIRRALDRHAARGALRRWSKLRDSLLVLSYHRVLPRDFDELSIVEPGMFVNDETFEMHLTEILKNFEPVSLAEWLRRREEGKQLPERACAVTFDDGWRDNYEFAFPILRKLSIPATIFVVSALVGTDYSFWPERLARRLRSTVHGGDPCTDWLNRLIRDSGVGHRDLDSESLSRVIATAKRETDSIIEDHLNKLDDVCGLVQRRSGRDLANWSELNEMADSGLITIGSHTRHHVRMRQNMLADQLHEEIVASRDEVEGQIGCPVELFCFPNGDMTVTSVDLVEKTYVGACTTERGWTSRATSAHAIPRVPMHEDRSATRDAFVSRLVGAM